MQNLFNETDVAGIIARIEKLTPTTQNVWGKMNAGQMMSHVNESMETARGVNVIKRLFIRRIIGTMLKRGAVSEKQFRKSSPTDKSYIFPADVDFEEGRQKTISSIKKFYEGGPEKCTKH